MRRLFFIAMTLLVLSACSGTETKAATKATRLTQTATATPIQPTQTTAMTVTVAPAQTTLPLQATMQSSLESSATAIPTIGPEEGVPLIVELIPSETSQVSPISSQNGIISYQKGDAFYMQAADLAEEPLLLEDCCVKHARWSPDGRFLLYLQTINDASSGQSESLLKVADLQGNKQVIHVNTQLSFSAPVWSPDGRQIAFRVPTNTFWDRSTGNSGDDDWFNKGFMHEIWMATMEMNERLQPPTLAGLIESPGLGCGGGGESWSDRLYDDQGGFALGFKSLHLQWAADDTLIYPLNCDYFSGYGRFDMKSGQMLARFPGELRGLVLSNERDRWFAISGSNRRPEESPTANRLTTGVPSTIEVEEIPTSAPVEIVYVGPNNGRLYFTSRQRIQQEDLSDEVGYALGAYYNFYHTQLWSIQPNGQDERLHWEGDDHSYSRINQGNSGDVLFTRIENDTALFEAVNSGVPEQEWPNYAPQINVMRQSVALDPPIVWLENTGNFSIWTPSQSP
jgi:hypothetical protein